MHGATSLEFAHGGFAVSLACSWQVIQSWISLDAILLAQWLSFLGSAVNLDNIKLSFGVIVKVFPGWSKFLAVATPWGIELNEIGNISLHFVAIFLVNDYFVPTVSIVMGWVLRLNWLLRFFCGLLFFLRFFSLSRLRFCSNRFRFCSSRLSSTSIWVSFFSLSKDKLCLCEHKGRKDSEGFPHL